MKHSPKDFITTRGAESCVVHVAGFGQFGPSPLGREGPTQKGFVNPSPPRSEGVGPRDNYNAT